MPWESAVEGAIGLVSEYIEDPDKKAELMTRTVEAMLASKTTKTVDALVKLAYASQMITKGLIRPLFSVGVFIYGLSNPDVIAQLHELGAVGDLAIAGIFGSAPLWGYSRHKEKNQVASSSKPVSSSSDWDESWDD